MVSRASARRSGMVGLAVVVVVWGQPT